MSGAASLPGRQVLPLLSSLVNKSLVAYEERPDGTGRYRLLETTRQYAREKLTARHEEECAQQKHLDFFLHLAEEAEPHLRGPEQAIWLEHLEIEQENLREALSLCQGCSERGVEESAESGLRLCGALSRFWSARGYLSEGRERYRAALSSPGGAGRTRWRARALLGAGILARMQGDFASARSLFEEGLAIHQEVENPSGVATALNGLGLVARQQREYAAAHSQFEAALSIYREVENKQGAAIVLGNLGAVAHDQGDYALARTFFEESLQIRQEIGDRQGIALALSGLGSFAQEQGDYDSARSYHEQGQSIFQEIGDRPGIAFALGNLGLVACYQGDYRAARSYFQQSLAIFQAVGDRPYIAVTLEFFVFLASFQQRSTRVARLWGAARRLREEIGSPLRSRSLEEFEQFQLDARSALGDEAWAAALSQGQAMTLDEAIDYALETREGEVLP